MKLGTIARLALIALGIASAVLAAHSAFGIRFSEDFVLFLGIVRDAIGFIVTPFELLIVNPVVRWLHEQGLVFELRDHWRNAFVLLWLFNASAMRANASPSLIFDGAGVRLTIRISIRWAWAALAALLGGALAGTVPLDHLAVLWWPVAAYYLFESGDSFIYAFRDRPAAAAGPLAAGALALAFAALFAALAIGSVEPPAAAGYPPLFWWPVAAALGLTLCRILTYNWWPDVSVLLANAALVFVLGAVAGALAFGIVRGPAWLAFGHSPSPGLANLAAFVAVLAAIRLLGGLSIPRGDGASYLQRLFDDPDTRVALDVFAVLGGAAIIVYLAHLLA